MVDSSKSEIKESEEQLVARAQSALSRCNWTVGECAFKWTKKYARGRTDADFANLVGMSGDQIYQRRRVWEAFGDVSEKYSSLKWSHFYVALSWDDAPDCLQWADENRTTVAEMKAWRRAVRGEDLNEEPSPDDWGGDPSISFVPKDLTEVRDPDDIDGTLQTEQGKQKKRDRDAAETVSGVARGSNGDSDYSPFRQGAGSPAPQGEEESVGVAVSDKPQPSAEQVLKRATSNLERINKVLTPEIVKEMRKLPAQVRNRFVKALSELNTRTAGLM